MKLAVISLKGKSSERIARAAAKYFDKVSSIDLRNVRVEVNKENVVMHESTNLADFDCVYVRGSFKYQDLLNSIAIALEGKIYMPVSAESFLIAHNKFLTEVKLKKDNIPFPVTHLVHKTEIAKKLVTSLHYPVVFKSLSGTHGKGVMFADSIESANSIIDMLAKMKESYLIQEFIETDASDIRALVIGNEIIVMKRTAKPGELRAGLHSGGEGRKIELSYEDKQLSRKVARALSSDIIAVDILKGPTKTVVTEVNLSPGIVGLTKATKIDVADKIAQYLYLKTKEFKSGKREEEKEKMDISLASLGSKLGDVKEYMTKLIVKAGRIILPPSVTENTDFDNEEEVKVRVAKDKIEVNKLKKVKVGK